MSTLTEFLLARIAEDESEASAHAVLRSDPTDGMPRYQSAQRRVLAECQAKRRIVEREMGSQAPITYRREFVLRDLASVYADHPDYDEVWRP